MICSLTGGDRLRPLSGYAWTRNAQIATSLNGIGTNARLAHFDTRSDQLSCLPMPTFPVVEEPFLPLGPDTCNIVCRVWVLISAARQLWSGSL